MKIVVTGGAGFVGANLSIYLKEKGYEVIVFDNLVRRGSEYNLPDFRKKGIKFIHGDVRSPEDVIQIPRDTDVICECAAQPSATEGYKNPAFDITNNSMGAINVLEQARRIGAGVIFWSTNKVYSGERINAIPFKEKDTRYVWDMEQLVGRVIEGYGPTYESEGLNPGKGISQDFPVDGGQHSIYGLSKIQADLACQEWYDAFGVRTVINRFSCLGGKRQWGKCSQGWISWFCIAFHFNLPLQFIGFGGKQVRDVLFTDDINALIELEIENIDKIAGQVFTIGGGMDISTSLIEHYWRLKDMFKDQMNPMWEYIETPRKADHRIYLSDISKIKNAIGWEPMVGLEQGTEQIVKWVKDNEEMLKSLYNV